jgi:hypothetical protein
MRRIVFAGSVLLVFALAATAAEAGKKKKKKDTGTLVGTITEVSADGKLIKVSQLGAKKKKQQGTPIEVKLNDTTKVEYIGIKAKDEQKLAVGQVVLVALDEQDSSTATVIAAGKVAGKTKKKNKKKDK